EALPGGYSSEWQLKKRMPNSRFAYIFNVLPSSREALAHPLALQLEILGKCWSEWQDFNLRPPRPERGALPDCATLRQKAGLITRVGKGPQARSQSEQPDDRAAGHPNDKSGTRRHYAQRPRG